MTELEIKAAIRARDGHRCTECGRTEAEHRQTFGRDLEVHRIVPGSEYSLDDGVCTTLCQPCHGLMPRRRHGSNKSRLVLDVSPEIKLALRLAAIRGRKSVSQVLTDMVKAQMGEDIKFARNHLPKQLSEP